MPGHSGGWVSGPGPGRALAGLSVIAGLCAPWVEGFRPGGEPQVSGESPLAVACVPSLPCPVACPSGSGCVHRWLPSFQYTTGRRACYARPGFPGFSPLDRRGDPGPATSTRPLRPAPYGPPRSLLYKVYSPFPAKPDRAGRKIRERADPGGSSARRMDPAATGERAAPPLDSAPGTSPSRACERWHGIRPVVHRGTGILPVALPPA
jgi:hypothetical protein